MNKQKILNSLIKVIQEINQNSEEEIKSKINEGVYQTKSCIFVRSDNTCNRLDTLITIELETPKRKES